MLLSDTLLFHGSQFGLYLKGTVYSLNLHQHVMILLFLLQFKENLLSAPCEECKFVRSHLFAMKAYKLVSFL